MIIKQLITIIFLFSTLNIVNASPHERKGPPVFPVTVENTPDVNVVNQPTVTIGGTASVNVLNKPAVQAEQIGLWDVNIVGTPGITIENGAFDPIPIISKQYPREIFRYSATIQIQSGAYSGSRDLFTVVTNRRLVIETVSVEVSLPIGQSPSQIRFGTWPLVYQNAYIPVTKMGESTSGTYHSYHGLHQTRMYLEPGETMRGWFYRGGGDTNFANLNLHLSGYLLPLDSPSLAP